MGGVAKKISSNTTYLSYLARSEEPGLGLVEGTWIDPTGAFRELDIVDKTPLGRGGLTELCCLAWGLNPRTSGVAIGLTGDLIIRPFASAIWRAATWSERHRISAFLLRKLRIEIEAWASPKTFAETVSLVSSDPQSESRDPGNQVSRKDAAEALIVASRIVSGTRFCLTDGASQNRPAGFGHVFTVPREVSILYALSDAGTREEILGFVDEAARAALDYYQRYAGRTRAKISGSTRDVECRYVAAQYCHITARPTALSGDALEGIPADARLGSNLDTVIDPHIHLHLLIPNLVRDFQGQFRAFESRYLLIARKGATAAFEACLAHRLRVIFGLTPTKTPDQKVGFSIKEIPSELIQSFANRAKEIDRYLTTGNTEIGGQFPGGIDKSSARIATRKRKETLSARDLDRHWKKRAIAIGFAPKIIQNFLAACRSPYGRKTREEQPLDVQAVIAIADRLHREKGMPHVLEEDLRIAALQQFLGQADGGEILDICNEALSSMNFLGMESKRQLYAIHRYVQAEKAVLNLAERELPRHQLVGLSLTGKLSPPWLADVVSTVLSGKNIVRYLEVSEGLERDLVIESLQALLREQDLSPIFVSLNVSSSGSWPAISLEQALKQAETGRLGTHAVVICLEPNLIKMHEMHTLLNASTKSGMVMIAITAPARQSGIVTGMIQRRLSNGGSGIYRQQSPNSQDEDDSRIISLLAAGHAGRIWMETRLAEDLDIVDTDAQAIESIAERFALDRRKHPGESQLVLTISKHTTSQLRRSIDDRCVQLGVSVPAKDEIVRVSKAEYRRADRTYVLTENQDQSQQVICRSRHRVSCYQVVSVSSLHNWLRDVTDDDPATTFDAVKDAVLHVLAFQWSRRLQKSLASDYLEERHRLVRLPLLSTSRYARERRYKESTESLKSAMNQLRTMEERARGTSGQSSDLGLHLHQNTYSDDALKGAITSRFFQSLQSLHQRVLAMRSMNDGLPAPQMTSPSTELQSTYAEGTQHGTTSLHIPTAAESIGRGALAATRSRLGAIIGNTRAGVA